MRAEWTEDTTVYYSLTIEFTGSPEFDYIFEDYANEFNESHKKVAAGTVVDDFIFIFNSEQLYNDFDLRDCPLDYRTDKNNYESKITSITVNEDTVIYFN